MRNEGRFLWAVFCFNAPGGGGSFCLTLGYGGWEVILNETYFLAIMF